MMGLLAIEPGHAHIGDTRKLKSHKLGTQLFAVNDEVEDFNLKEPSMSMSMSMPTAPSTKPSSKPSTAPSSKPNTAPSTKPSLKPSTAAPVKPPTSAPVNPPTPDPLAIFSLIISSDPQYPWYTPGSSKYPKGLENIFECNVETNPNRQCPSHNCLDTAPCDSIQDDNPMKRNSARMISQQYHSMIDLKNKRNIQGVIINGDLTNLAKDWQWEKARALVDILSDDFSVFPSLGNHDYDITNNLKFNGALPDATRMFNTMTDWLNNQWNSKFPEDLSIAPKVEDATKFCGSMDYSFNIGKIHILQLQYYPSFTASQQPSGADWIVDNGNGKNKTYSITASWDFMESDLATARNDGKIILVFLHDYGGDNLMPGSADKI